ncbi:DUF3050 domain-containing protein [Sphingobacterium wenxiniae]|uniref:DUF3050 domain-containing protein n=1 Tax=Sphingobacterium wenxiniae TaxID=683125 RepID=A0A1I6TEU9_9SPHI|nr:DUF3050 domain-containing protein [Sphingobacterium wenxiniae]SFS87713.1 Protein of unknown function [Sphingobacterium wenxiniae]
MDRIQEIKKYIQEEQAILLQHSLYNKISDITHLRKFTETHVYAVWDFMSLLKALQSQLTCVRIPWFPSIHSNARYLINEIVLAEESDEWIDGRRLSHYEMYLDAMKHIGADTTYIQTFVQNIQAGAEIDSAIAALVADSRVKDFLYFTFDTIARGKAHEIASAFTFGREDLIPVMFTSILRKLQHQFLDIDMDPLLYYFQRHIELDGDEHGPLAMQMILELGGDEKHKWEEMKEIAKQALSKRIALWDAIEEGLTVA